MKSGGHSSPVHYTNCDERDRVVWCGRCPFSPIGGNRAVLSWPCLINCTDLFPTVVSVLGKAAVGPVVVVCCGAWTWRSIRRVRRGAR